MLNGSVRHSFLLLNSISLYGYTTVCSPVDKCFRFLAIIGETAVNICGQVLVCILYMLSLLLGFLDMKLLDHMANECFKFRRNYQTFPKESVLFLHSHQQCMRVLVAPHCRQHSELSVCLFFNLVLLIDVDAHLFFFFGINVQKILLDK